MGKRDLTGQRFGKLVVLQRTENPQKQTHSTDYWLCRCDCGNETVVLGSNLTRGHTTSCGCKKLHDLTGRHIGKLAVICRSDQYAQRGNRQVRLWKCVCDCGNITYKATDTLTSDMENSCAECAQKRNAACARENAGFISGTQLGKIRDMTPSAANTSGCRGVYYDRRRGFWEASIKFQSRRTRLGCYKKFEDAVVARKKAERIMFGRFLESLNQGSEAQSF